MDPHLAEQIENGIATLTFNRPDSLNAISDDMLVLLREALFRLGRDPSIAVIALTGAGRAFCAGGDVKGMKGATSELSYEQRVGDLRWKHDVLRQLAEVPKLTVALVNGSAAGAGLGIALACDLRIATASAKFITSFVKVGFAGDFGGSYFLTKLLGSARARELYLLSEKLDAAEAFRIGLVTRVHADERFDEESRALLRDLASGPRLAYGYIKRNIQTAETGSLQQTLDAEASHQIRLATSEDHTEAIRAFRDKRAPIFRGR